MNVFTDGELIPITAVPAILRQKFGRSPDVRTIKRWRKEGVCKGTVTLQTTRRGCHVYTTHDWLNEFFAQQDVYYRSMEAERKQKAKAHQTAFRKAMHRKHSRRANHDHQEALKELNKIYGTPA